MDKTPEAALSALLGREATPEELTKIHKVKENLGLSDHDAIWTLLLALGHYEMLYCELPDKIGVKIQETLTELKANADNVANAAERRLSANVEGQVAETINKLSDAVIQTGQKLAQSHYRKYLVTAIGVSLGVAGIIVCSVFYVGYKLGNQANSNELFWSKSSSGIVAKRFAQLNDVQGMLSCLPPLQQVEKPDGTYCLPYDKKTNQVRSWRID